MKQMSTGAMRECLDLCLRSARRSSELLEAAVYHHDPDTIRMSILGLGEAADDVVRLMDGYFIGLFGRSSLGASEKIGRWWEGEASEIIENLRTALEIDGIVIESYLKNSLFVDETQRQNLMKLAVRMNNKLGLMAQFARSIIKKKMPELWTEDLEKEFRKHLDINLL
jgi:hypothetical protein